jgi:hypothetical protein
MHPKYSNAFGFGQKSLGRIQTPMWRERHLAQFGSINHTKKLKPFIQTFRPQFFL